MVDYINCKPAILAELERRFIAKSIASTSTIIENFLNKNGEHILTADREAINNLSKEIVNAIFDYTLKDIALKDIGGKQN